MPVGLEKGEGIKEPVWCVLCTIVMVVPRVTYVVDVAVPVPVGRTVRAVRVRVAVR